MTDYLSVSKAAKLVGASRDEIQEKVRRGLLPTFEGQVSIVDLRMVYPHVRFEDNTEIERMKRLQDSAVSKGAIDNLSDAKRLKLEVLKLRHELHEAREELRFYQRMTRELKGRLVSMQADCTHRQKLMLRALLSWMSTQIRQNRHPG